MREKDSEGIVEGGQERWVTHRGRNGRVCSVFVFVT